MAGSLNVLRLASHVLIALVRIHDRLIHVRKPLVMFVVHRSMVASTTDIPTQSVLCEAANFALSGHEMVNQLLGASEVETFVRGDMDNEVCECAVSILETTVLHFGCTPTRLTLEVSKRLACVSLPAVDALRSGRLRSIGCGGHASTVARAAMLKVVRVPQRPRGKNCYRRHSLLLLIFYHHRTEL